MARIVDKANLVTAPVWAGDFFDRDHMIPGGAKVDASLFTNAAGVTVTVGAAGAAAAAVSVPVAALSGSIPAGTTLNFGTNKFATLSATAAAGATSLAVLAIPTALVSGDKAVYSASPAKVIASGTVVGRTIAERDASAPYGPAADTDDEVYLVCFDLADASINNDVELYRPNSVVKENFVPGFAALTSAIKTKLRAAYVCTIGAA